MPVDEEGNRNDHARCLLRKLDGLDSVQLSHWIERGWVRPEGEIGVGGYLFGEFDVARVELIRELRGLDIDDDTMPLVLGLLDQMRRIRLVQDAIMAQAPEVQQSILEAVAGSTAGDRRSSPP